jgi:hypothetical protein
LKAFKGKLWRLIRSKYGVTAFTSGQSANFTKTKQEETLVNQMRMANIRYAAEAKTRIFTAMLLFGVFGTLSYI